MFNDDILVNGKEFDLNIKGWTSLIFLPAAKGNPLEYSVKGNLLQKAVGGDAGKVLSILGGGETVLPVAVAGTVQNPTVTVKMPKAEDIFRGLFSPAETTMIKKSKHFLTTGVWRIRLKNEPPVRAFCITYLRVILLAIRGFTENKCQLKASALTFNALLSIIPVAAIAFGIAKGFGYQEVLREQLLDKFSTHKEGLLQVMNFAMALLETTRGG